MSAVDWKNVQERIPWLIDWKMQLRLGEIGQHHIDLGWAGDEIATGDILFYKNGGITLRLLHYDPSYDANDVCNRACQEWDQTHPGKEIDDVAWDLSIDDQLPSEDLYGNSWDVESSRKLSEQLQLFDPGGASIAPPDFYVDEFNEDAALYMGYNMEVPIPCYNSISVANVKPNACFGFINGKLYLGSRHHMAIMSYLIENGMSFEELEEAEQAWGWVRTMNVYGNPNNPFDAYLYDPSGGYQVFGQKGQCAILAFSTDAGRMDEQAKTDAKNALEKYYGIRFAVGGYGESNEEYAPNLERLYGPGGNLSQNPDKHIEQISKWILATDFAEIKFVCLPDRILIGEDTYHVNLLMAEYGDKTFPINTLAIGRAFVKNDEITSYSFDYVKDLTSADHARRQLEEYAESHGYIFNPSLQAYDPQIIGLSSIR